MQIYIIYIILFQGPIFTNYTAGLARAYTAGGYTDWYLPSKDELNRKYQNISAIGGIDYYSSSTESSITYCPAWRLNFSNGTGYLNDKKNKYSVETGLFLLVDIKVCCNVYCKIPYIYTFGGINILIINYL